VAKGWASAPLALLLVAPLGVSTP